MQEVQLDKKVTLLDCPGLVMAGGNKTDASVALRNAIKVKRNITYYYFGIILLEFFFSILKI